MGPHTNRGRVIRQNHHPVILAGGVQSLFQMGDQTLIQIFDGLDFPLHAALVAHLIGSLHMDIDEVIALFQKHVCGRLGLALIIGVKLTVGPLHLDIFHACSHGDALQKIYRGNHGALFVILLFKRA